MRLLQIFRTISLIEGVTTILLFLVAMPLKYWAGITAPMYPIGMAHGVAWVAFLAGMVVCLPGKGFSVAEWIRTFVFALFPFGAFLNDPLIRARQEGYARRQMARA